MVVQIPQTPQGGDRLLLEGHRDVPWCHSKPQPERCCSWYCFHSAWRVLAHPSRWLALQVFVLGWIPLRIKSPLFLYWWLTIPLDWKVAALDSTAVGDHCLNRSHSQGTAVYMSTVQYVHDCHRTYFGRSLVSCQLVVSQLEIHSGTFTTLSLCKIWSGSSTCSTRRWGYSFRQYRHCSYGHGHPNGTRTGSRGRSQAYSSAMSDTCPVAGRWDCSAKPPSDTLIAQLCCSWSVFIAAGIWVAWVQCRKPRDHPLHPRWLASGSRRPYRSKDVSALPMRCHRGLHRSAITQL